MLEKLKDTDFATDLLEKIILRGFGSLTAREVWIETLTLILKHHPDWKDEKPTDYELARILKISPRKVRGYLDEIRYRDSSVDEGQLQNQLIQILKNSERLRDGSYVALHIQDGLVRAYLHQLIIKNLGIVEIGSSGSIIKMSGKQFSAVCFSLMNDEDLEKLMQELEDLLDDVQRRAIKGKSLAAKASEAFVLAASEHAAKRSVDVGMTILTGGLSQVLNLSDGVASFLKKD